MPLLERVLRNSQRGNIKMRKKGSISAIPSSEKLRPTSRSSPKVSTGAKAEIRKVEDAKVRMAHRASNIRMG